MHLITSKTILAIPALSYSLPLQFCFFVSRPSSYNSLLYSPSTSVYPPLPQQSPKSRAQPRRPAPASFRATSRTLGPLFRF